MLEMKSTDYFCLQKDDCLILVMALKALQTLRLDPHLTLANSDLSPEAVDYMNDALNGFASMCCDLDLVVKDPAKIISELQRCIQGVAGDDVYQAYADELKYGCGSSNSK